MVSREQSLELVRNFAPDISLPNEMVLQFINIENLTKSC